MADDVVKEYDQLAGGYDRRWASYISRTTHETLKRLPRDPARHFRLLDVGCGTGILLQAVLERFPAADVVGIDSSLAMLDVARRRLPPKALLLHARAEALPLPDGQFDAVLSCNAFHFFDRPREAINEMKRILSADGQLVITDWCDDFLSCKLCGLFLRAARRPFHRIYGTRDLTRLLVEASFHPVTVERYKISLLWGLMTAWAKK